MEQNHAAGASAYLTNVDNSEKVELHLSCTNLDNEDAIFGESDGQCVVYQLDAEDNRQQLGQTEVRNNDEDPEFKTPITMDFIFEVRQRIIIAVYDIDGSSEELIGETQFDLSKAITNQNDGLELPIVLNGEERGKIKIRPVLLGTERYEYFFNLKVENAKDVEWWSKTDPFLTLERPAPGFEDVKEPKEIEDWTTVYKTEVFKNNLNPDFKPFKIFSGRLNLNNFNIWNCLTLWDYGNEGKDNSVVGRAFFKVSELLEGKDHLVSRDKNDNETGDIIVESFSRKKIYSLADYVKYGVHLSNVVAIDFTASNGNAENNSSLHHINPNGRNKYEQAILGIGSVLKHYDSDGKIPTYGYGFTAPSVGINEVTFCYPLNGNFSQPHVRGFEGVCDAYRKCLPSVEMAGPTKMAPIIEKAIEGAAACWENNKRVYNILTILTDGASHDTNEVIELLQKAKGLPLSIIIVGLGSEDMSDMKNIDNAKGHESRDIIQFVHFDEHCANKEELAKELLHEVPLQMVQFYTQQGIFPN